MLVSDAMRDVIQNPYPNVDGSISISGSLVHLDMIVASREPGDPRVPLEG